MSDNKPTWFTSTNTFYYCLTFLDLKYIFRTFPTICSSIYNTIDSTSSWGVVKILLTEEFGKYFLSDFNLTTSISKLKNIIPHVQKLMSDFDYLHSFKNSKDNVSVTDDHSIWLQMNNIVECGNASLVIHWIHQVCLYSVISL